MENNPKKYLAYNKIRENKKEKGGKKEGKMLNKFRYLFKRSGSRRIDLYDINQEQLEKMSSNGAIIIDVRSPQEYAEGHLKGAISLPEYELPAKEKEILKEKEATIIVYCSSGFRSKRVQKKLQKKGYTKVYNLYNGFQNY